MIMALVREHAAYGGFDSAEAAALDALGYGHDALLGLDAAALFGGGRSAGAAAYVAGAGTNAWASTGSASVLAFDRATAAAAAVGEEEEECDAWIDAMDQSDGAAAAPEARHAPAASVGFDAATGCFTLTERASSSGGAGRPFGLLFPSTSPSSASLERAAPARASQKRTYVVSARSSITIRQFRTASLAAVSISVRHVSHRACTQDAVPQAVSAKRPCGSGRKTKDPQSLAAKVTKNWSFLRPLQVLDSSSLRCFDDLIRRSCCRIGGSGLASGCERCKSWCPTAPRSTWSPCSRRPSATSSSSSCKSRFSQRTSSGRRREERRRRSPR